MYIFPLASTPSRLFFHFLFERAVRYVLVLYYIVPSLFWLSLCKVFFIYFLSCPVVINYIVKKMLEKMVETRAWKEVRGITENS